MYLYQPRGRTTDRLRVLETAPLLRLIRKPTSHRRRGADGPPGCGDVRVRWSPPENWRRRERRRRDLGWWRRRRRLDRPHRSKLLCNRRRPGGTSIRWIDVRTEFYGAIGMWCCSNTCNDNWCLILGYKTSRWATVRLCAEAVAMHQKWGGFLKTG